MAVRLLATFKVTFHGAPDTIGNIDLLLWWPKVGGVAEGYGHTGIMTLDGRYCDRNTSGLSFFYAGFWPAKNVVLIRTYGGAFSESREYAIDPIMLVHEETGPNTLNQTHPLMNTPYIKLADRNICYYPAGSGGQHSFRVVVDATIMPSEGPPPLFGGNARCMAGRNEHEVFLGSHDQYFPKSQGVFYNTVTKDWSSKVFHFGRPCNSVVYATDWDVFVTRHNATTEPALAGKHDLIRIWATEVHPTILSEIEVFDGELKAGHVVTYRVKATGDDNDPAEDEVINWYVSGIGQLLDAQSTTDEDGYATARVAYGLRDTGPSQVEARLIC